jgi:hypothetical protein
MPNKTFRKRRLIIRAVLVIAWISLGAILFVVNRGHTLLVDNRGLEAENLRAPDIIKVSVDRGKGLELLRGDRDMLEVRGGSHLIRVEFPGGGPPLEKRVTLSLMPDMFLLSIPRMIRGDENCVEVFSARPESPGE